MNLINEWYKGLVFPFKEQDWLRKMWTIPLIGIILTPFVQLLVLRGWRVELVKNIGNKIDRILPSSDLSSIFRYLIHGLKLYLITGLYLLLPWIVFKIFGINPFKQLFTEVFNMFGYLWHNDTTIPISTRLWYSFWAISKELLIKNIWLLFYYPYYRSATIRYSLTGEFRKSHLAFRQNFQFMIRNIGAFLFMVVNQIVDMVILFFVNAIINIILTPFIGYILAPLFFFYASFWTSGFEYGQLAQRMVDQDYSTRNEFQEITTPPPIGNTL